MKKIPYKAELHELGSTDTDSLYKIFCKQFSADDVYLLESAGGPEVDVRAAYMGGGLVLSLSIRNGEIVFDGDNELIDVVTSNLEQNNLLERTESSYRLTSCSQAWKVIELFRASFSAYETYEQTGDICFGMLFLLGYDAVHYIEKINKNTVECLSDCNDIEVRLYAYNVVVNLQSNQAKLYEFKRRGRGIGKNSFVKDCKDKGLFAEKYESLSFSSIKSVSASLERDEYIRRGMICKDHIAAGDIYQIQLGYDLSVVSKTSPEQVYNNLRLMNPSPYMYFVPLGNGDVFLGASPESYIRIDHKREIVVRPIAGTARRGKEVQNEAALVEKLCRDEKEVAEHVMLVDLCRNDLSKVIERMSMNVSELIVPEYYSHVIHLVSEIRGRLRKSSTFADALKAFFPAGTMTGAPKIRAMDLIDDLETTRRGLYSGVTGLIDMQSTCLVSALNIRGALYLKHKGEYVLRASAGIVADSCMKQEWLETMSKMASTYFAITGREIHEDIAR